MRLVELGPMAALQHAPCLALQCSDIKTAVSLAHWQCANVIAPGQFTQYRESKRCRRRSAAVTGRTGAATRPTQRVLELLFGEDELAAVGVQHRVGRGASIYEVYEQEELIYRETDGRVVKSPGVGGGGRQTHRAVLSNTPLVNHLDFVAVAGIGGKTCYVLACC